MWKLILFLWCCLASGTALNAQPVEEDLPQITGCIALVNAKVVTMAGKEPVVQNIVLRNGLITAIGADIKLPTDAYKIAADSLYVYPAFIDAFSNIGIKEPDQGGRGNQRGGQGDDRPEIDEEGNASLEAAGITPFNHVRSSFDPKEKSISDWRAQGFAVAHIVPRGRMIPGQGAIAVLSGKDADQMLWKEDVSFFGQWAGAGNTYPGTIIGVMAKWRELYHNAAQDVNHLAAYNANAMVSRPPYNQAHEALAPLVKKEKPLYFKANGVKDISRALEMQKDLGMKMVIADAKEAWYLKNQFKTNGIPLVLSLDLPEDKAEAKEEKGKEKEGKEIHKDSLEMKSPDSLEMKSPSKVDSIANDPEKEDFEKRRAESLKLHFAQAGVFAKEGIPFSFCTMSGKTNEFSKTMQTMIENGLDATAALNALTMQPAKLLGIDKYCGSLEAGKMANLIVSNKPIFEKEAAIRYMIVEGTLYEYEIKEKKKPSSKESHGPASALAGTWSYAIETPEQKREGTFEFSETNGEWKGTITSSDITSGNSTLKDIVLDGQKVSFTYDLDMGGQTVEIEFDLTVNGESLEGNVTVGEFGSFPVTGTRTSTPH
jgi:imidazolonepropionase-like amidohydrolase